MGILSGENNLEPEQQQVPQQQPPVPNPYIPQAPSEDFFRFRIDGGDILDEIQHQLKGEVLVTQNGKEFYEKRFEPWCNDEGVNAITSMLYSLGINKNIILGCLQHEEIYIRMNYIWKMMAKIIVLNYNKFEIEKSKRSALIAMITQQIHSALSRSEDGREADDLSTAAQRTEHIVREEKAQGGQMFDIFNRGRQNQR